MTAIGLKSASVKYQYSTSVKKNKKTSIPINGSNEKIGLPFLGKVHSELNIYQIRAVVNALSLLSTGTWRK